MALNDVVDKFKTGSYTITRAGHGTYVNGVFVPASTSTLLIDASVQPATGRQLAALPEGQRAEDVRVLWTKSRLRTREDGTPDIVTIGGENYVAVNAKKYEGFRGDMSGDVYEILVAKQGVP